MPEPNPDHIADEELRRDQRVYRALKRKGMTETQVFQLFRFVRGGGGYTAADYRRYQARLLEYGADADVRIRILPKDRVAG